MPDVTNILSQMTGPDSSQDWGGQEGPGNEDANPYVKDPKKLWADVQALRDAALEKRRRFEAMWRLAWRYYRGEQWIRVVGPDYRIERIDVGKKPKLTINRILPVVQTRKAHILKNRPIGTVLPATSDEEDRNAARTADKVMTYYWRYLDIDGKMASDIVMDMLVTGNSFLKVFWDPIAGPKKKVQRYMNDPTTGAPMVMPPVIPNPVDPTQMIQNPSSMAGMPIPDGPPIDLPIGDIACEVVRPQEFLPDPGARRLRECQKVLHRALKPLAELTAQYGKEATQHVRTLDPNNEYGARVVASSQDYGFSVRDVAERVEVVEAWFKPNEDYPEGLHAVFADEKMMVGEPTPEGMDPIPFIHFQELETDEFWGTSTVVQILDPQRALNLNVSRNEYRKQMQRPVPWVPHEAGVDEEEINSDDASIVRYQHPYIGTYLSPPPYPEDNIGMQAFTGEIDAIAGSADILRGEVSGDVRSGRQVAYLQEYAGTVLSGPARSIERGIERMGNMILKLLKVNAKEDRIFQIVGRNREVEIGNFLGSDLDGVADYVVQTGSALPMSRMEKKDYILELLKFGIVNQAQALRMLDVPSDLDALLESEQADRDNATEENNDFNVLVNKPEMIKQAMELATLQFQRRGPSMHPGSALQNPQAQMGIMPIDILKQLKLDPRPDFENNEVHLEIHNRFRKTKAYRMMPDDVKGLFDAHCMGHLPMPLPPSGPPVGPGDEGMEQGEDSEMGGPEAMKPGAVPPGGGGAGGKGTQERAENVPPVPPSPQPQPN